MRAPTTAALAVALAMLGCQTAAAKTLSVPATPMSPAPPSASAAADAPPVVIPPKPAGAQTLRMDYGPLKIKPGQNLISVDLQKQRPAVNGWIVGFRPGMVRTRDKKAPPVGEIHLHHAVWLVDWVPTFASGEEKTWVTAPDGYGWRYTTKQHWLLNHMIHNLTPTPETVNLTVEIDFIPDDAPQAQGVQEITTRWMDVQGLTPYPVFDVKHRAGKSGRYVYPDDDPTAYRKAPRIRNRWVVTHDATLVGTIGHVHPGGLWTDLFLERGGKKAHLFRSNAHYFEPAGPVSWDLAMGVTRSDWKIAVRKGDVLSTTTTYETRRGAWYESMGIMPVGITKTPSGGVDPFTEPVDMREVLSHPRLPENIDSGGRPNPGLANAVRLRDGPLIDKVAIRNFSFAQGDLSVPGRRGRPPVVPQGRSLTFVNREPGEGLKIFHTVTGCAAPCNRTAGISYPLANGAPFDSGELGYGPKVNLGYLVKDSDNEVVPITPAAQRITFKTPSNLKPGTYTYFCRVHPFMRGAFRVKRGVQR
jgi:hypothetical protein